MRFDVFVDFLEQNDIDFRQGSQRILLRECFECGYDKFKTSFRPPDDDEDVKALWGKCFKCGASFSSYRYLIDLGLSSSSVKKLHNFDEVRTPEVAANFGALLAEDDAAKSTKKAETYRPSSIELDGLFSIGSWLEHPAAKYAIQRGIPQDLFKHVMIDPVTNSVVFLCWEGDKVVGWQKRFVRPPRPNFKTQNPPADVFKKSMHVIEYPNDGPVAVVEGPFTGISGWHFGYHSIVTFGSSLSGEQLKKIEEIARRTGKPVYVAFDLDPAGFRGYFKIKNYMERRGIEVKRLRPEAGNDLNDSWAEGKGAEVIENDPYDSTVPVLDIFSEIYSG